MRDKNFKWLILKYYLNVKAKESIFNGLLCSPFKYSPTYPDARMTAKEVRATILISLKASKNIFEGASAVC